MPLKRPSDALADQSARLRRRDHSAIERQTRRVQVGIPISGDPRPSARRTNPPFGVGLIPAIVTQAIGPCSGTTPGTGKVQLYYLDKPDDTSATADQDNNNVPVLNWYTGSGTIGVGKHVQVYQWANATWLATWDC